MLCGSVSLVKIMNSRGPIAQPCDTPARSWNGSDRREQVLTSAARLFKKWESHHLKIETGSWHPRSNWFLRQAESRPSRCRAGQVKWGFLWQVSWMALMTFDILATYVKISLSGTPNCMGCQVWVLSGNESPGKGGSWMRSGHLYYCIY